jgi:uncharacterized protein with PhoU and TrkA domain
MSKAEELAATLNAYERSGIWYTSSDAANELRRLQAEVDRLTAENAELRKTLLRYVKEVPLGNQPPMLADVAYRQAIKETP